MPVSGRLELGHSTFPRIIVSFSGNEKPVRDPYMDIAELRIDRFPDSDPHKVCEYIRRFRDHCDGIPLLGTVRMQSELGNWRGSERERAQMFAAILPEVHGIDIEYRSEICPQLCRQALHQNKTVIVSWHDAAPENTESPLQLPHDLLSMSDISQIAAHKFIVKIATRVTTLEHLASLLPYMHNTATAGTDLIHRIILGMGRYGPLSRIIALALGGIATYVYPEHAPSGAVAPGQLPLGITRRCMEILRSADSLQTGLHQCMLQLHQRGMLPEDTSPESILRHLEPQLRDRQKSAASSAHSAILSA